MIYTDVVMFARKIKALVSHIASNRQLQRRKGARTRSPANSSSLTSTTNSGNINTLRDKVLLKAQRSQTILILITVVSTVGVISLWGAFSLGVDGNALVIMDSFINQICIYLMLPLRL